MASCSWNIGTCLPEAVVDYLCHKQQQVKTLELITDTTCLGYGCFNASYLHNFKNLRRIRWVAGDPEVLEALREILHDNATTLEEIEIDGTSNGGAKRNLIRGNIRLHQVISLRYNTCEESFLSLKKLTLSGISFEDDYECIPSVFSFHSLTSLTLHNCAMSNQLFDVLGSAGLRPTPAHLKSFEMSCRGNALKYGGIGSLAGFLSSFCGLENLSICCAQALTEPFFQSIRHHKHTLRQFVLHRSMINTHFGYGRRQPNEDALLKSAFMDLPRLELLGINISPGKLVMHSIHKGNKHDLQLTRNRNISSL